MSSWHDYSYYSRGSALLATVLIMIVRLKTSISTGHQSLYQAFGIYLCVRATITIIRYMNDARLADDGSLTQCPGYHNPFLELVLGMAYLMLYRIDAALIITFIISGFNLIQLGRACIYTKKAFWDCIIEDSSKFIISILLLSFF